MAYRPPTQTKYAALTAPPPGRFNRGTSAQDTNGWITPSSRGQRYGEHVAPYTKTLPTPEMVAKSLHTEKEFPTLCTTPSLPKKTWGSSDSMAERMKKQLQEEEENQMIKEQEKLRKELDNQSDYKDEYVTTNIISHQSLMRRFNEDKAYLYEEMNEKEIYESVLDEDGYGYECNNSENVEQNTSESDYEGANENDWEDHM